MIAWEQGNDAGNAWQLLNPLGSRRTAYKDAVNPYAGLRDKQAWRRGFKGLSLYGCKV